MKVYVLLALLLVSLAAGQEPSSPDPDTESTVSTTSTPKPVESSTVAAKVAASGSVAPKEKPAPGGEKAKPGPGGSTEKRGRRGDKGRKEASIESDEKKKGHGQRLLDGKRGPGLNSPRHQEGHRRSRRSAEGQTLALLSGLLSASSSSESGSSSSECSGDCSGEANTNNRLVDQINVVMAKLMSCKHNNNGYPYYGYPYWGYNPCYYY